MASKTSVLLLFACAVSAYALSPARKLVSTPKELPSDWEHLGPADPNQKLSFYLVLNSRNVEELEKKFWEVSDPEHSAYGQHLNLDELASLSSASASERAAVLRYLKDSSLDMSVDGNSVGDLIKVQAPARTIEQLLDLQLQNYRHLMSSAQTVRTTDAVYVPEAIAPYVRSVWGLTRFPPHSSRISLLQHTHASQSVVAPRIRRVLEGDQQIQVIATVYCSNGEVTAELKPKHLCADHPPLVQQFIITVTPANFAPVVLTAGLDAVQCTASKNVTKDPAPTCFISTPSDTHIVPHVPTTVSMVTVYEDGTKSEDVMYPLPVFPSPYTSPDLLMDLYHMPLGTRSTNPNNRQALAEFLGEYYSPAELKYFFESSGLPNQNMSTVIGPNNPEKPGGEATLDVQYMMAMSTMVATDFLSFSGGSEIKEPYLDWMFEMDQTPDDKLPLVVSVSYGDDENDWSDEEVKILNEQFIKQGLRGVSLLFSSGDDGVGGFRARDNEKHCHPLSPEFPASSPYVTAVGGTQLSTRHNPLCSDLSRGLTIRCSTQREVACSAKTGGVITTGGGFSRKFSRDLAPYQTDFVESYLESATESKSLPPNSYFNRNGRGYPDLSAIARNYLVFLENKWQIIHGTSASCPVVSGMVSMLNEVRLDAKQRPLGFLNPWLYKVAREHPEAFYDVVIGDNACTIPNFPHNGTCCPYYYNATVGWDPVTGLGTPRFDILRNLVIEPTLKYPAAGVVGSLAMSSEYHLPGLWSLVIVLASTVLALVIAVAYQFVQLRRLKQATSSNSYRALSGPAAQNAVIPGWA